MADTPDCDKIWKFARWLIFMALAASTVRAAVERAGATLLGFCRCAVTLLESVFASWLIVTVSVLTACPTAAAGRVLAACGVPAWPASTASFAASKRGLVAFPTVNTV
jgi:hypothetical protein